jgi:hypothetical protein
MAARDQQSEMLSATAADIAQCMRLDTEPQLQIERRVDYLGTFNVTGGYYVSDAQVWTFRCRCWSSLIYFTVVLLVCAFRTIDFQSTLAFNCRVLCARFSTVRSEMLSQLAIASEFSLICLFIRRSGP